MNPTVPPPIFFRPAPNPSKLGISAVIDSLRWMEVSLTLVSTSLKPLPCFMALSIETINCDIFTTRSSKPPPIPFGNKLLNAVYANFKTLITILNILATP